MSESELEALAARSLDGELSSAELERLWTRLAAGERALEEYLEDRRLDHDLRMLLSPGADPEAFLRGLLNARASQVRDPEAFARGVARRLRRRRGEPRGGGAAKLCAAALFVLAAAFAAVPGKKAPAPKDSRQAPAARAPVLLPAEAAPVAIEKPLDAPIPRTTPLPQETTPAELPAPPPSKLPAPARRPTGRTVAAASEIEEVEGQVLVLPDGAPALPRRGLVAGDGLRAAGVRSGATLSYPDGTQLDLHGESELREESGPAGILVELSRGSLTARAARQSPRRPMIVRTPHGESKVLGTVFRLTVGDGFTRLEVLEGKVRLTRASDRRSVDVPCGFGAVAGAGIELAARPLPRTAAEEILEARGTLTIKFGPPELRVPDGALLDSGEPFSPERGYGWAGPVAPLPGVVFENLQQVSRRAKFREPVAGAPLRGSVVFAGWQDHPVGWSLKVPNGRYRVSACAGDPQDSSINHVWVEGRQVLDAVLCRGGEFAEREAAVHVRDGELDLFAGGQRADRASLRGCRDTHLQYLVVTRDFHPK